MVTPTIVTLDQAKTHAKLPLVSGDGSPSSIDADLQLKLDAATQQVCDYIADRYPVDLVWLATIETWGTGGSPDVLAPPAVRLAVLEQFADHVRRLGDDAPDGRERGDLNVYVANLLKPYRSPSLV